MKTIAEHMSFYDAYHRNPWNKATHFIGIPSIIYSILVPLSWPSVDVAGFPVTAATVFVVLVLIYYFVLEPALAAAMVGFIVPSLYLAHVTARTGIEASALVAAFFFVWGWIWQIIGHVVFEKRRPALVDNLFQLVIGPIFLVAEVFFLLGFKQALRAQVRALSVPYLPDAAGQTPAA